MSAQKIYWNSEINSFKYEWKILDCPLRSRLQMPVNESYFGKDPVVKSPSFFLDDSDKWNLGLFSSSRSPGSLLLNEFKYGIGLWRDVPNSNKFKRMRIQCKIVFDNTKAAKYDEISIIREVRYDNEHNPVILDSGFLRHCRDNYLITLTVICYFHIGKNDSLLLPIINNPISKITGSNLSLDFGELFNNKKLTDITFILDGDKKIQAHKAILTARSPVFAAMLSHPMKEQNDKEVHINDIKYEVFEEILRYIYTDEVSDLNDISVIKLLYAADKYGLGGLKEKCGTLLEKEITIDNAAETFIYADRYNLRELITQIQCFVREHLQDFVNSSGYDSMIDEYPELAKKVLKSEKK